MVETSLSLEEAINIHEYNVKMIENIKTNTYSEEELKNFNETIVDNILTLTSVKMKIYNITYMHYCDLMDGGSRRQDLVTKVVYYNQSATVGEVLGYTMLGALYGACAAIIITPFIKARLVEMAIDKIDIGA